MENSLHLRPFLCYNMYIVTNSSKYIKGERKMKGIVNPVAKNCRKFNKATVQTDRKKETKKGYIKHKRDWR